MKPNEYLAWTETDYAPEYYPGMINIKKNEDGKYRVLVRQRGQMFGQEVNVPEYFMKGLFNVLANTENALNEVHSPAHTYFDRH